ncbi:MULTISPECIES: phage tail tape measure protein [unclassified Wolbachia]|uniref:glycine zipper family protein n=1 Tax=unclassified Wolbachia TaxID=2640676 RepID=UPI001BD6D756|nr:glycine zipper family protein [Wolbachia endosymbiont of Rhagoletis cerasi]MBS9531403.1 glycine zipper family protein [Wolbachia endosymbiont of Rhagoletis cerasi]
MVQGGAVDTGNSEYLAQGIFEIIQGDKALQEEARKFLDQNEDLKNLDSTKKADIISLLENEKSEKFFTAVSKKLSGREKFKKLAEQVGKNLVMEEKLEALGNQLLAQGLISGAAVTTLTGALAGTLAIGGVTGALIVGGAALVGFVALVAIAAIGYAIYQHRGEIKEGAMKAGKEVKSFVKDVIDKLPTIQDRENNFEKLISNLMEKNLEADEGKRTMFSNEIKIIKMLRNQEQLAAIGQLIGEDKAGLLNNLISKGTSTHEEDMQKLLDLMKDFQPAIMAIGDNDIEKVREKVNEKVKEMKPSPEVKNPSSEQVDGNKMKK